MGHHVLGLLLSTVVMLGIFAYIVVTERKCGRRSADFFKRTAPQLDELAQRAEAKYRSRYGKDPTLKLRIVNDEPAQKTR